MIHRGESLFLGGMDAGIYAGRMVGIRQNASLCDMIPLCVDAFFSGTLGAIPDDSQRLKMIAIRLDYVTVVNVNHRLRGYHFPDIVQVCGHCFVVNALFQVVRQTVYCIRFLRFFLFGKLAWPWITLCRQIAETQEA